MTGAKTRCQQCIHKVKSGTEEPCSVCGEIQYRDKGYDNHFIAADKNLIKAGEVK